MTQFTGPTYQIDRPTRRCAFTDQPLQPGDLYMATLVELSPPPHSPHSPDSPNPPAPGDANPSVDQNNAPADDRPSSPPSPADGTDGFTLKRVDVSMQAWQRGDRPPNLFSYWKTKVPQPTEKKQPFVDDQVMINLLGRLADTDQPQRLAFRFVLTLLLMRKKLLRYDGTETRPHESDPPQEWWKLTLKPGPWSDGQPQQLEVLNPRLDEQQIKQASEQLGEILETEL